MPKMDRHTLGEKIDTMLLRSVCLANNLKYIPRATKVRNLAIIITALDASRIILRILLDLSAISAPYCATLLESANKAGAMAGGYKNYLAKNGRTI